jgi:hypothetical protein
VIDIQLESINLKMFDRKGIIIYESEEHPMLLRYTVIQIMPLYNINLTTAAKYMQVETKSRRAQRSQSSDSPSHAFFSAFFGQ